MDHTMLTEPVFIVGAPRSGTTWLQLLLSQSPSIASCNETHLFSSYLASLFKAWSAFQDNTRPIGLHHLMTEAEYFGAIADFAEQVFRKIRDTKPAASVVLEKTPAHGRCWRSIVRIFPNARFIHLVRDPRAVVASLRRAGTGWGRAWADPGLVSNSRLWLGDVQSSQEIDRQGIRYYQVTYESLMAEPVRNLSQLFRFLQLSESEEACAKYVAQCRKDRLHEGTAAGQPWDTGKEPPGFFGKAEMDGWKVELRSSEVALIEDLTFPFAEQFGYRRTRSPRRFHIRAGARSLMDRLAEGLAWRYSRLRARL